MLKSQSKGWLSLGVGVGVSGGRLHEWGASLEEYFVRALTHALFSIAGCWCIKYRCSSHRLV